ncbi:hypothetical protein [Duganella sp. Root1480D1]|uniref:hypothetical protein n=1 Tax=Duganella sp. Root1480D1 TaxID=1736471 RepID=UPI00070F7A44|nr:hypothetical protein [Duganella sp. Root1480D1]KQZ32558.1 hypothetical protein ASD58_07990 [Duganella sp. Root1480D1]
MIDYAVMLRPRARARALGYLMAICMAIGALTIGHAGYLANRDAEAVIRSNEHFRARQAAARQEPSRQDVEFRRQWTLLQQERAFPWERVFRAAERASDPEIELLEFRPDRRKGTLVLRGEGQAGESVMRYLERLQEDPAFSRAILIHTSKLERGHLITREFELHLNLAPGQFGLH